MWICERTHSHVCRESIAGDSERSPAGLLRSGWWSLRCTGLPSPLEVCRWGSLGSSRKCQIWTRLTIEHFSTLKQSILNEPWPTGHDGASGPCSHMASFFAWQNHADEWCNVVWGPEDHGHPTKVFGLVPYTQRFLWFLWIFWCCYALYIMRFAKPLEFDVEERFPQSFYALFHRLEILCPSLLLRDSASLRHPFYS